MLNHISIMGRLTKDPELRRTGSGVAVTSFTIACDRDFNQDGKKETDFIECVAWKNTAEFVSKYFKKGSMAIVAGRLQIRKWQDKDGNNRQTAEIVANNVYFGDSKKEEGYTGYVPNSAVPASYGYQAPVMPSDAEFAQLDDDDAMLPF